MLKMMADQAVEQFGDQLVGRLIITVPYGDWQGGAARVLAVNPDPGAPDIVMTVKAERRTQFDSRTNIGKEIGVFDHEEVGLIDTHNLKVINSPAAQ